MFFSAVQLSLSAQSSYWQQEVHYNINVKLNDKNQSLHGAENIQYINHSPDTLPYIWFHVWPNAYKDSTTALFKQLSRLKDRSDKLKNYSRNGYIDSLLFNVNGKPAVVEAHPEYIDVIKIILPENLLPGGQALITTPFMVKIPAYISRLGFYDNTFMITQWHPKPAVYDSKGWHPMPYLDQGEFYSEFGSYTVNITVPSAYVVGATGTLQNQDEVKRYKTIGANNYRKFHQVDYREQKPDKYTSPPGATSKTLVYHGKDIHDFAWFADKDFVIQYDTLRLNSGKQTDVFSFYQPDGDAEWMNSIDFIKDATRKYSEWIGEYPYPVVNAVEGPKNSSAGGMEYPMITLITNPGADKEKLDAVITHEVGHNWFYGVLASNERDHAWMDEGINSYYQFRYEAEKYKENSIFGKAIPLAVKQKPTDEFIGLLYNAFSNLPMQWPIETPLASFPTGDEYAITVYIKAAMWMYVLETSIGKDTLDKGMKAFFNEWKFRHPYPEDLKNSLEKSTGSGLSNIFSLLHKEGSLN